jgi:hypothetical protein
MSSEGGGKRFDGSFLKICLWVLAIGALVALCVYVTILKSSSQAHVNSSPTTSATSTQSDQEKDPEESFSLNRGNSSKAQPSKDEIWDFETAYNTTDPVEQLKLLKKIATAQYIDKEYSATTIDFHKLVVKIDRTTSTFSVQTDLQNSYCEVTTNASLKSFRNGKFVASYPAPKHVTVWINTKDGWKVASEKR